MDYPPRRIIAMTREGFKDEVLHSFTIWLCASCYVCTVECPKQIKITDIMYSLKQRAIQEKVHPKRFPIPVLAREFFDSVIKWGRNTESRLILRMYLKSNPLQSLRQASIGMRLWLTGRLGFKRESLPRGSAALRDFHTMMETVEKESENVPSDRLSAATEASCTCTTQGVL
jgi:heterodisulfide reductase subunit C